MTLDGPRLRLPSSVAVMWSPGRAYARWQDRYGDSFLVRAVNGDVVCTADPAVVRDLFRATDDQVQAFRPDVLIPFLGPRSVFALSGEAHRRERKLLMPPFHGARMRAYGDRIQQATLETIAGWQPGEALRMSDAMLSISLQVIVEAVFGVGERHRVQRWLQVLRSALDSFSPLALFVPALQQPWLPSWRRFVTARQQMDALLFDEIATRRRADRGDDILSMLLEATYEDGSTMDDAAVRDELVTLLFAGHETTQISMAWALYLLHRDPALLGRLRDELDTLDGTPAALADHQLLDAVVQETLRIDPIVPDVLRTLTVPMTLGDLQLPAGAHVAPLAIRIHHDPELYPDPGAFRPERFLERRYRPWEFLPFGGGTRRCVGAALATYEMKIVLGTLLREVILQPDGADRMVRRTVTLAPKHGVPMRFQQRR